jgi:hypothetical protein
MEVRSPILTHKEVRERVAGAMRELKRLIPNNRCFGTQSIHVQMPEHGLQGVLSCDGLRAELSGSRDQGRRPGNLHQEWYYHEPEGFNGVKIENRVIASGAWDYGGMGDELDFGLNGIDEQLDWEAILLTLGLPFVIGTRLSQNRAKHVPFAVWRDKCGHQFDAQLEPSFVNDPRVANIPRAAR